MGDGWRSKDNKQKNERRKNCKRINEYFEDRVKQNEIYSRKYICISNQHHHHYHNQGVLTGWIPLTLSLSLSFSLSLSLSIYLSIYLIIRLYWPSLFISSLDGSRVRRKLINVRFCGSTNIGVSHVWDSIEERLLGVHANFFSNARHIFLGFLRWFVRLEVSDHTTAIFSGATSKIYSNSTYHPCVVPI